MATQWKVHSGVDTQTGLLERPQQTHDYVRLRAAEMALPQILSWIGGPHTEASREQTFHDLAAAFLRDRDGFALAEEMQRMGWGSVDAELVRILDEDWVGAALDELEPKWVLCVGIKAVFKVGDRVRVRRGVPDADCEYEIVSVDDARGKYGVATDAMKREAPTRRYIVRFEDVESLETIEVAVA